MKRNTNRKRVKILKHQRDWRKVGSANHQRIKRNHIRYQVYIKQKRKRQAGLIVKERIRSHLARTNN